MRQKSGIHTHTFQHQRAWECDYKHSSSITVKNCYNLLSHQQPNGHPISGHTHANCGLINRFMVPITSINSSQYSCIQIWTSFSAEVIKSPSIEDFRVTLGAVNSLQLGGRLFLPGFKLLLSPFMHVNSHNWATMLQSTGSSSQLKKAL